MSKKDQLRALWDPYSWVSGGSLDPGCLHLGRRIVASGPPGLVTVRIPRTPTAANRRLAVITLVPCLRWTRTTMPRSGGCCTTTATIRNGGSGATW